MLKALSMIWGFLNSSFLIAIVTVVTGTFVYGIYKKQKRDSKQDAANIILLEIKNAERKIRFIRELLSNPNVKLPEEVIVLPTSNWGTYKYLFIRDFDRDAWDSINEFYNKCRLLDEALESNKSYFQKNEIELRANRSRILMDYLREAIDNPEQEGAIMAKRQVFIDKCIDVNLMYEPQKPVNDSKKLLTDLGNGISQTSIGIKLALLSKNELA